MATVALEGLHRRFGATRAIDDVSLHIASGEFVTLLGPSGCGKTTTLRAIAGLVEPDAGRVLLGGADVTRLPTHRRAIGMVFQSHALFPHMTVADNVGFGLRMRGVAAPERLRRVEEALALVRLPGMAARYPSQLSGGQQQRVALARALVIAPQVLLLDEPFGALDRKLREAMQAELRELTRRLGITAVFVTHDQEEALILSDRVAVMNAGRIEQIDSPGAMFERPRTRFVADFMGVGNILAVRLVGIGADGTRLDAGGLALRAAPEDAAARAAAAPAQSGALAAAIRAERIALAPASADAAPAADGANGCEGEVTSAVYHGSLSTYLVRPDPAPGLLLTVREANASDAPAGVRFASGARVRLAWPAAAVRLLDR